jgi:hypothetical protein
MLEVVSMGNEPQPECSWRRIVKVRKVQGRGTEAFKRKKNVVISTNHMHMATYNERTEIPVLIVVVRDGK